MKALTDIGLGLDYGTVRLRRTVESWLAAGVELARATSELLGRLAIEVEQVGSSSVPGLLAKPIIDLAIDVPSAADIEGVRLKLAGQGWIYRGDAGDDGGHVFVLEASPRHRVAHAHVVRHGGEQWLGYLRFRDLLRRSSEARNLYEAEKLRLASAHMSDHVAYTAGKTAIVAALLGKAH